MLEHAYDALDRRVSTVDALGRFATQGYDARGRVLRQTDANGNLTVQVWDDLDRLIEQRLPEDRILRFVYDVAGNLTAETDARGATRTSVYDELDRLVETRDPAPFLHAVTVAYDAVGNKLSETNRRGHTSEFTYDALDRVIRRTSPPLVDGTQLVQEFTYDAAGNLLTDLDPRTILSAHAYDAENRRLTSQRAGLLIETRTYDANGNVLTQTDANGNVTTFDYDERSLVLATRRPLSSTVVASYNDQGNRLRAVDPEGRVTTRTYDLRQRLIAETAAAESGHPETTEFTYDLNGNRLTATRAEGGVWSFVYDAADRLITVTDPEQGTTEYAWDKNDNPLTQTDGNANPTAFVYDALDRVLQKTLADGAFEALTYDENGNAIERRDANGRITVLAYDVLDRLLSTVLPPDPATEDDLQSIAQLYDANGNLLEVRESFAQSGEQSTQRSYDLFDRLESETNRWGHQIRYGYDANGNRTRLTDPAGTITRYAYDALNRLSTVTTSGGTTGAGVTEYAYLRDGQIAEVLYPKASRGVHTYGPAGRLATLINQHAGALVSSFAYTYDLNGNRVEQLEEHSGRAVEVTTYFYDRADRLREVAYPEKTTTYVYDGAGNRQGEQERDTTGTLITNKAYRHSVRNELEGLDNLLDPTKSVTYAFDANGNQIGRTRADGSVTAFAFDTLDRLIEVEQDGVEHGRYRYDAQGLRIEKITAEGTARYVYDEQSVLTRTTAQGTTKYDYGPDRLLSVDDPTTGRAFYLFDALGSVTNLMTPQGAILARYQYDAWGNYRERLDTVANPFGFTGHEHDLETGLIYAKARFYDPELGLFLSEDPASGDLTNPPSLHRYLYAFQNPTVFVDPDGRLAKTKEAIETLEEGSAAIDDVARSRIEELSQGNPELGEILDRLGGLGVEKGSVDFSLTLLRQFKVIENGATLLAIINSGDPQTGASRLSPEDVQDILADIQAVESFARSVSDTLAFIEEDPLRAAVSVDRFSKEQMIQGAALLLRLGQKDPQAIFDAISSNTQLGLDALLGAAFGSISRVGSTGARAADELGEVLEASVRAGGRLGRQGLRPGDRLPDGRIAGDGPGAALRDGPDFSPNSPSDLATDVAGEFGLFECVECAESLARTFRREGIKGRRIEIRTANPNTFAGGNIWHEGLQKNISANGRHQAVEVDGLVFDNFIPKG